MPRVWALAAVLVVALVAAAQPPSARQIAGWVEDLASEDTDTWRQAADRLWKAGKAAEPALRAAMKHPDPDVRLRARLVLGRFDWGIYPDTPEAVVKAIERFRSGDRAEQRVAIDLLVKQSRAGHAALRRLLARETDAATKQYAAEQLRKHYRPLLRDHLAAGETAAAVELLETSAASGNADALRDLAALWALTGQAKVKAAELERTLVKTDLKTEARRVATLAAWLHRAIGDLEQANRLALKAGDTFLAGGIVDERQDFKELARGIPDDAWGVSVRNSPAKLAVLMHFAGRADECDAALKRLADSGDSGRASVLFFTGRPRQAIDAYRKTGSPAGLCILLAGQGRRREALELSADPGRVDSERRFHLLLEQVVVAQLAGEKATADQLLAEALRAAEASKTPDGLLAAVARAGGRMNRRDDVVGLVAAALDRLRPPTPRALLGALSTRDGEHMVLWWDFLRHKSPAAPPSVLLAQLRGWFERGKADKEFDALLAEARKYRPAAPATPDQWSAALARACAAVGKAKQAEEVLTEAAKAANTAAAYLRLGDLLLEQKRPADAATEYARAAKLDPAEPLPLYLQGVALRRAGREKEGQTLVDRARLMPLADEAARYNLAQALTQRNLSDEAAAEWLVLIRTCPFRSIYAANAAVRLANRAAADRPLEAAQYFRRVYLNLAFGGGGFIEVVGYLRVPALAHLNQCRGLIAAGKLDDALVECRRCLDYLPEDITVVPELVRALDRADRRADAQRLFDSVFPIHRAACADYPNAAGHHNRLAWLAVRGGRRLDEALRHARRATELAPDFPGYHDTLAEVQFQRGNQAAALTAIRRALKLAPERRYYAEQLKRMQAGDPRAALPPR